MKSPEKKKMKSLEHKAKQDTLLRHIDHLKKVIKNGAHTDADHRVVKECLEWAVWELKYLEDVEGGPYKRNRSKKNARY